MNQAEQAEPKPNQNIHSNHSVKKISTQMVQFSFKLNRIKKTKG